MISIRTDGADLNVFEQGRGAPLLFVHGFPLDHTLWLEQFPAFASTHRVIAPDLRGFGASSVTEGLVSMERFADDLAALLDALQIAEPVVFCGLSMGGYIGWEFARKYASRLRALVQCDTRAAADAPEAQANRLRLAEHALAAGSEPIAQVMIPRLFGAHALTHRKDLVEALRLTIKNTDPQAIAAAQRGMAARADATAWLPQIAVPTLLIVGEEDQISPVAEMQAMAAAIAGAELAVIPQAGHLSPRENPAAFNAALRGFLDRLP